MPTIRLFRLEFFHSLSPLFPRFMVHPRFSGSVETFFVPPELQDKNKEEHVHRVEECQKLSFSIRLSAEGHKYSS